MSGKRDITHITYETNETNLDEVPDKGPVGDQKRKGGSTVAGKDLSTTRSSHRKGRKAATSPKKLEEQAD